MWVAHLRHHATGVLGRAGFSLLLTTIFQYLDDEAGDEAAKDFMGVVIGAFSVGQIIGAPFWGSLTSRTTYLKVFVGSIVVRMLGNVPRLWPPIFRISQAEPTCYVLFYGVVSVTSRVLPYKSRKMGVNVVQAGGVSS